MLVGLTAGGWLLIRALMLAADNPPLAFGVDIPVAAAFATVWAGLVAVLLHPLRSVIARRSGPFTAAAVLVWPLGRRFRVWTMVAAPVCGLLAAGCVVLLPMTLWGDLYQGAELWLAVPFAIGLTVVGIAATWIVLRAALHGVELTSTHLIARGFFITRRYVGAQIVSINVVELKWWPSLVLSMMMNRSVEHTLQLSLEDGTEPLLFASNSHPEDVEAGAEIVRAWRAALDSAAHALP
ncbi:hypothetical protein GCM10009775_22080 [Microbacterium aoyamense]|uniref:PH domain-containing protein n=2 Tax=Microbacterium aoyamense TaxID=344166 RepID=A0ABP5B682_9MICO